MAGTYLNKDGLYLKYGTTKAVPIIGGDFLSYGQSRNLEIDVDISTLTTTASIINDQSLLPAGVFIDSVEVVAQTAGATFTTFSVGTMKADRVTAISDSSLVAAMVLASVTPSGVTTILTTGSTYAGTKVGTTSGVDPGYITAKITGAVGTGLIKVRIRYRGLPPITQ